jgi:hypothetical protein
MVKLPVLVLPSESPAAGSQRIYLALIVFEFRTGSQVALSQRGGRKLFNRGSGGLVSKDLHELRAAGWLSARQVGETEGLGYSTGRKFERNPALYEEWQAFATSLLRILFRTPQTHY